ncbi:DNA polymerase III subunit epsilon [Agreia pratensis]|uniref:exonuclease domain-containing protein n=1 Tax=Agreia pratensis TaxID=150121 RepID=UPI00188D037F|nr:exonuclease domain-containing protein [Agreia pratensis]MBF4635148.1 DNA polymerase III subunit epsilon [Agreia pratensis]
MAGPGFAVLDFETTGLFPGGHDRVVEVAVVHVNDAGRVTGQWETLVNPQRDLGAQHIHGIRSADILDAPTFAAIAPHLVDLLGGRVLVAHSASFDLRFLLAELARSGYAQASALDVEHLCTMQLARDFIPGAGRSLADCCAAFDIELENAHRASVDAAATARLLGEYIAASEGSELWNDSLDRALSAIWPTLAKQTVVDEVWRAREATAASSDTSTFLQRIAEKLPEFGGPAEHQNYWALLDQCLLDRQLSVHEANSLVRLAGELSISRSTCERLHIEYFEAVVNVAWADGVLTLDEIADLTAVATLLGLPAVYVAAAVEPPAKSAGRHAAPMEADGSAESEGSASPRVAGAFRLEVGDLVVLTGDMRRSREDWHRELERRGFVPRPAITKKVKLVVACDPDSLSGKARKARDYGITIVNEAGLERLLVGGI